MKKAFTLIELMVTVAIVVMIAVASTPSLNSGSNRANADSAAKIIRDLVSKTQTYALAPERTSTSGYILVMNKGEANQVYGSKTLEPSSYGIFTIEGSFRFMIKQGRIPIKPGYYGDTYTGYTNNNLFIIHFRNLDGIAGCSNRYYDDMSSAAPNWASLCVPTIPYITLSLTSGSETRYVRINKITGETEACKDANCNTPI